VATLIGIRNEDRVLKTYRAATGRSRIENIVIGQATEDLKRGLQGLTNLLKYWRDEASHGSATNITDNQAYVSLSLLLRYSMFVSDNWKELTQ